MLNLMFLPRGWEDYLYWQGEDKRMLRKINRLLDEISRTPTSGTGKPEALRENWAGWWSRRLDGEHRIVYKVESDTIIIAQIRFHYGN
ncbi:MAG: Txe/YoeB family addiction module toxin [Oscillibacter sp.]|nr:Txe/YoeB family addiction module toxin [Oscillibacter sp.]